MHLIGCNAEGLARTDLSPQAEREFSIEPVFDVTSDGRQAVITVASPASDREEDTSLALINLDDGITRTLVAENCGNFDSPCISPDGRRVAAVKSVRSATCAPQPCLVVIDISSGACDALAADWDCWPSLQYWSGDGNSPLVTADHNGIRPLFEIDDDIAIARPEDD